jgi:hypothetical protein
MTLKRSGPLERRTPLKQGTKGLARTTMKPGTAQLARKPMPRGDVQLARQATPMRQRSKTNSNPRPATGEAKLCKGQPCYLRIPGVCTGQAHDPCHSNQAIHGKGKSIKAHDVYTVPGCRSCHDELDQGMRYTRVEKFAIWDAAYARWEPVRAALMAAAAAGRQAARPPALPSVTG